MQGQYQRAHAVKVAADTMHATELASTQAAWDAKVELRRTRLQTRHAGVHV